MRSAAVTNKQCCRQLYSEYFSPSHLPKVSNAYPCGLADALSEAPTLFDSISCKDWAALAGCNRQLRNFFHSSVRDITVNSIRDVSHYVKGLPLCRQLILIKIKPTTGPRPVNADHLLSLPDTRKLQLIASLVSTTEEMSAAAVLVQPQAPGPGQGYSVAAAFSHLRGLAWQQVRRLSVTIHLQGGEVMRQLAHLGMSRLNHLALNGYDLGLKPGNKQLTAGTGIIGSEQLTVGIWPQLPVCNNQINAALMTLSVLAEAYSLTSLSVSSNHYLSAAVIPTARSWLSLSSLSLQGVNLDAAGIHAIAELHRRLEKLLLYSIDLNTAGTSQLFLKPWPLLCELGLPFNQLAADAVAALVPASLPSLTILDLGHNELNAPAVGLLANVRLPQLVFLVLDHNELNNAAMTILAKGQWPNLEGLSLIGKKIKALGIDILLQANWPRLCNLCLDSSSVCAGICSVLDLPLDTVSRVEGISGCFMAQRDLARDNVIWPRLKDVMFCQGFV